MTREETNDKVYDLTYQREITETEVYELVDKIHDDFESRTCENCRFLVDGSCTLGIRHFEIDTNPEDFGCNKFEPKD